MSSTDQTLDSVESVGGVGDGLASSSHTYKTLTIVGKRHNGWGRAGTFSVLNDTRGFSFHDGNARVGSTEIDTNNIAGIGSTRSDGTSE